MKLLFIAMLFFCGIVGAQPVTTAKSALVIDSETHDVLYQKNLDTVRPIASITKLMTALVIVESQLPLDQPITVAKEDVKAAHPTSGNLRVGTVLTRSELLRLALMSSQNRAAAALARTYPGGTEAFVSTMNAKAVKLGMVQTTFTDPTGLWNTNVSTANDLIKLVNAAYAYETIREYSVSPSYVITSTKKPSQFNTTNELIKQPDWDITLQKTGYISDAGRCVVVVATVAARRVVMILLNAPTSLARRRDIIGLKYWVENKQTMPLRQKELS